MWKGFLKEHKNEDILWNFDSTGCVLKKIEANKRPYLYTMAWHDKEKKLINNIFNFLSCCHKAVTIGNYLNIFKANLLMFGESRTLYPHGIVTDCSFAFINAVQFIFNKLTITQYLDHCYEFLLIKYHCQHQSKFCHFCAQFIFYIK